MRVFPNKLVYLPTCYKSIIHVIGVCLPVRKTWNVKWDTLASSAECKCLRRVQEQGNSDLVIAVEFISTSCIWIREEKFVRL